MTGMQTDIRRRERDKLDLDRLVFFSDAVFAIAITLLAIDIRLPDRAGGYTEATLQQALIDVLPGIFAFGVSFTVIALFWVGHYRTFRVTERVTPALAALNLLSSRSWHCCRFRPRCSPARATYPPRPFSTPRSSW
jgi:uncharacterized membrane protein